MKIMLVVQNYAKNFVSSMYQSLLEKLPSCHVPFECGPLFISYISTKFMISEASSIDYLQSSGPVEPEIMRNSSEIRA